MTPRRKTITGIAVALAVSAWLTGSATGAFTRANNTIENAVFHKVITSQVQICV